MPLRCPVPLCARRRHGGAAARHVATHGRESVDAVAATAVTVAATLAVLAQYLPADLEQYLPTHAAAWALHAVAIAYRPARLVIAFGRTAPLSAAAATGAVVATPADQAHAATRRLANLQQLRVFAVLILSLSLAAAHASGGITAIAVDAPNATAHAAPGASLARARCRLSSCATAECIARVPGAGSWLSIVAHRSHADGWLRCVPAVCATAASASSGRASPGSRRGRLQARTRSGCGQVLDSHGRQGKGALVCGREPLRRRRARPTVHAVPGGTACPNVHD
mmetsp:Transcript_22602/g.53637  ORF Transcript_22602/g.53637 Transcript_22602/m.53637 type:complete len:282 (+) Transcript_22602:315-1160(+)